MFEVIGDILKDLDLRRQETDRRGTFASHVLPRSGSGFVIDATPALIDAGFGLDRECRRP
jgi:hypothetical protein